MTIEWQNLSRGFQGGFFVSSPTSIFEEGERKSDLVFAIKQVDETFFLLLKIQDFYESEPAMYSNWCLGEDFAEAEFAKEFADYVLESYCRHGNLSRLPFTDLNHWVFERL